MRKIVYIFLAIIVMSCGHKTEEHKPAEAENKELIELPSNSPILPKLEYHTVSIEQHQHELSTSGTVKAIPNSFAQIASPFSGRITKCFVKLGQRVSAGSPIFEISSPDFFEATRAYFQAKQEMQLGEKFLNRQRDLTKNGVGIQKDLEEAEFGFDMKKKAFENASAGLKVFNVNPNQLALGQPLIVRSPIAGEVVENNIVLGQFLKDDAEPVALVAELSKVWVAGQIKEKDLGIIKNLKDVEITLAADAKNIIKGKIFHVSELLDEATRSVQVLIECDNKDRLMKPGMYVTTKFGNIPEAGIMIPATSILQAEGNCFVYVKQGNNSFAKRIVETGDTENDKILIKSGLKQDEVVVSNGGYYLLEQK